MESADLESPVRVRPSARLHAAMSRYVAGDETAFAQLYGAIAPKVRNRLSRMVHDGVLVEDLLQLTFLRAHLARERFQSLPAAADRAIEAWYLSIARNVALDHMREHYRRERRHALVASRGDTASLGLPEMEPNAEEIRIELERADETAREVLAAVEQLPVGQREVIRLHKLEGLPMAEVAARLQVREGAVRVRAHRAYKNLGELLAPRFGTPATRMADAA
jgi:RNA polymerase sigma-70 factor (ECF subfamily)